MKNLNYKHTRVIDLLVLIFRIQEEANYYPFADFDGDSGDFSFEIYEPLDHGGLPSFPIASMHGIGESSYFSFNEAEETLSEFLVDNKKENENE